MKTTRQLLRPSNFITLIVLFVLCFSFGNAQVLEEDQTNLNKPEIKLLPDILWAVKAYLPEAKLIKIKAIDKDGKMYNVKAIQHFNDSSILNIKAIVNNEYLPIKLIVKEDDIYYPLKAVTNNGILMDVKAVTEDGTLLPVKGIGQYDNVVLIRAIGKDNSFYSVFAISPEGKVNDVKGVKMLESNEETIINGISIFAHVKALRQE